MNSGKAPGSEAGSNRTSSLWIALTLILAVFYFLLTFNRTLNTLDEGYLLYNFLKTARGLIPHRDFYDDYGPGSYWIGGALFQLFGVKLIVIRIFVLVLKTAMALLIFLIARKLLPPLFSLAASMLFVLNWGDPVQPGINILYAGHLNHFFALVAIFLMILYVEKRSLLWLAGTSLCLGISLLFKFPTAIIDFMGFAVFVSLKEQADEFAEQGDAGPGAGASAPMRGLRILKCLGLLGVMGFHLALFAREHLDAHYFFIFLAPYFAFLAHMLKDEVSLLRVGTARAKTLNRCYLEVFVLMSGPLVFLLLEALFYGRTGGIHEFLYDTFQLPLSMNFYKPMTDVTTHVALIASLSAAIAGAVFIGGRLKKSGAAARSGFWLVSVLLLLSVPVIVFLAKYPYEKLHLRAVHVLPPVTLFLVAFILISFRRKEKAHAPSKSELALSLLFIFSCQCFLMSFPRTDETHIQLNCTVVFILISFLLYKASAGWRLLLPEGGARKEALFTLACAGLLALPYLWSMRQFYVFNPTVAESESARVLDYLKRHQRDGNSLESYPMLSFDFQEAWGINVPLGPAPPLNDFVLADLQQAVSHIRKTTRGEDKIFVLCDLPIIYFLTGRESVFQREDYYVFLASTGLMDFSGRSAFSDDLIAERLAATKPKLVVWAWLGSSDRLLTVWPWAFKYIRSNYRLTAKFGYIEILQLREG